MKEINIARTLLNKRRQKGITQDELADYIGVSKASVSKWETGQCYPDITLLPQLAAYFNISIDELMDYTPQMGKEDIRKLYHRLAARFADGPFEDALAACRAVIKKYYSCFPLLMQMATLLVNHHMLAACDAEKESLLREAIDLYTRVASNSGDVTLSKEAVTLQAICHLTLKEPQRVLDLLGETVKYDIPEKTLIAQAYQSMGNPDKAKEIMQIDMFLSLLSLLGSTIQYLGLCANDFDKAQAQLNRAISLLNLYHIDKLNPNTAVLLYITGAQIYCLHGDYKKALAMLERYVDICVNGFFPVVLHGDAFFDAIDPWLADLDLGTAPPRSEKVIKESMLHDVLYSPLFACLQDEPSYKNLVQKLKNFIGGD